MLLGKVEAVLRAWLKIDDGNAAAFKSRVQHLQRMNFPPGTNTGRGKKFDYDWLQIIQFSLAFDLIDQGMAPELATTLVKENEFGIESGLTKFSRILAEMDNPQQMIMTQKIAEGNGVFLGCIASGLSQLKRDVSLNGQFIEAYNESDLVNGKSLTDFLLKRNVTFLNFASNIIFLIHYRAVEFDEGINETIKSFQEWVRHLRNEKVTKS